MAEIVFTAEIVKVQTMADYGIRLTLDLPETAIKQAAELMECKRSGIPLTFTAEVEPANGQRKPTKPRF
jgi:hypothetical protein